MNKGKQKYKKVHAKMNKVRRACKSFGIAAIALFQRAIEWRDKQPDLRAARLAHSAYQRTKRVPSWLARYIEYCYQLRAPKPVTA